MLQRDGTAKVSLEGSWDGSQLEAILPLWRHLGVSGDIFTCHRRGKGQQRGGATSIKWVEARDTV